MLFGDLNQEEKQMDGTRFLRAGGETISGDTKTQDMLGAEKGADQVTQLVDFSPPCSVIWRYNMQGVLVRPRHNLLDPLCIKSNEYCQLTSNPSGAIIRSGQMSGDSKSHCVPTTKNQEGVRSSIQEII
jgi:hypothetical protein